MKSYFEIRFGREAKMYTLWRVINNKKFISEHYVKNLSTSLEDAIAKAMKFAKTENRDDISIDAPEELNEIKRGDDVLRFGRNRDSRVSEIDSERYLIWLFRGAQRRDDNSGIWYETMSKSDPIRIAATEILIERGIVVEFNDRLMTKEAAENLKVLMEKNSNSNFIGVLGERIEIDVTVEKSTYYETAFGTIFVFTMRDKNDNVIVYRGQTLCIQPGEQIRIKGTIKDHSEYKGVKQTIVQRVKIL